MNIKHISKRHTLVSREHHPTRRVSGLSMELGGPSAARRGQGRRGKMALSRAALGLVLSKSCHTVAAVWQALLFVLIYITESLSL